MSVLPDCEWRFTDVQPSELWACFVYEYIREAFHADPNGELTALLDSQAKWVAAGERLCPERPPAVPVLVVRVLVRVGLLDDLGRLPEALVPYLLLSGAHRAALAEEFPAPPPAGELLPLETSYEELVDWREDDRAGSADCWERHLTKLRVFPLFIPPGIGRRELERRFSLWVDAKTAEFKKARLDFVSSDSSLRNSRKWTPDEMLRALAAQRWVKHFGGVDEFLAAVPREGENLHEAREYVTRGGGRRDVDRLVNHAMEVRRALVRGELRKLRLS